MKWMSYAHRNLVPRPCKSLMGSVVGTELNGASAPDLHGRTLSRKDPSGPRLLDCFERVGKDVSTPCFRSGLVRKADGRARGLLPGREGGMEKLLMCSRCR